MYVGQTAQSTTAPATSPSFADILQQAVPAALQLYRERQAAKLQIKRAEQGLPPLPVEYYSPPVRVQGSIDQKTMLLAGGAIAAIVAAILLTGRRRRA